MLKNDIVLVAIDPKEAEGIIKVHGEFYMLRPPYPQEITLDDLEKIPEIIVDRVILHSTFKRCNEKFETLSDVVEYIKRKYLETKEKNGEKIPELSELKKKIEETIKYFGEDFVKEFYDNVKKVQH